VSESLPPPEEIDPGPPVAEIAALAESPEEGFLERIRGSILRRIGAGHLLDFVVPALLDFLKEIGEMLFNAFERPDAAPGAPRDE
jgi:hypothetical protein